MLLPLNYFSKKEENVTCRYTTNRKYVVKETKTSKPVEDIPMDDFNTIQKGWQCPVCGSILAPFVTECPCKGKGNKSANYIPKNNVNLT